jgi:cytochrome c peroxidase
MSAGRVLALSLRVAFVVILTTPADAQMAAPSAVVRSADERGLTNLQLLGKRLFEDKNLSEPRGMSCASCHAPAHAFQGNNGSPIAAVAAGSTPDKLGRRKTPTIMYKTYSPAFGFYKDIDEGKETIQAKGGQFWDGRASDLAEQPTMPLLDPVEMNNPSIEAVVEKVKTGDYAHLAVAVFGKDAFNDPKTAMTNLASAIFAYEATPRFAPFSSKFDDYLRGKAKLTPVEARGFELFTNPKKGNCIACHVGNQESKDPTDWIFTDFTYDALGVPRNRAIPANAEPTTFDLGLCKRPGIATFLPKDVQLESLCGRFKVPTLRNVAIAGPYYHNGYFTSLRDAVAFYATRDTDPKRWYQKLKTGEADKFDDLPAAYKDNVNAEEVPYDRRPGQMPRLSDQDVDALVAFLRTLTDKSMQ